jgi:hypothetical protein
MFKKKSSELILEGEREKRERAQEQEEEEEEKDEEMRNGWNMRNKETEETKRKNTPQKQREESKKERKTFNFCSTRLVNRAKNVSQIGVRTSHSGLSMNWKSRRPSLDNTAV